MPFEPGYKPRVSIPRPSEKTGQWYIFTCEGLYDDPGCTEKVLESLTLSGSIDDKGVIQTEIITKENLDGLKRSYDLMDPADYTPLIQKVFEANKALLEVYKIEETPETDKE